MCHHLFGGSAYYCKGRANAYLWCVCVCVRLTQTVNMCHCLALFHQNSYVGGGSNLAYVYPCRFIACYFMIASCLVRGDESLLRISRLRLSITRLLLAIIFLILTTAAFIQIIVIKSSQVPCSATTVLLSVCLFVCLFDRLD